MTKSSFIDRRTLDNGNSLTSDYMNLSLKSLCLFRVVRGFFSVAEVFDQSITFLLSAPIHCFNHITFWGFLIKNNTNTRERDTIKIDKRESIKDL